MCVLDAENMDFVIHFSVKCLKFAFYRRLFPSGEWSDLWSGFETDKMDGNTTGMLSSAGFSLPLLVISCKVETPTFFPSQEIWTQVKNKNEQLTI